MLVYMGEHLGYREEWYPRLKALLEQYGTYLHQRMGFPHDWERLELWR